MERKEHLLILNNMGGFKLISERSGLKRLLLHNFIHMKMEKRQIGEFTSPARFWMEERIHKRAIRGKCLGTISHIFSVLCLDYGGRCTYLC